VTVSVVLTPTGSIKNIKIVSSTDRSFNQAAIEAATRLRCSGGDLRQETEIQWKIAYESTQPAPLPPHDAKAAIDPRKCVKPAYPAGSLRPGEQRVVKMKFHVNANEDAVGGEVVRSSGSRRLDQAAIDALIVCRFKPALEEGKPVEGYAEIDYIWKLE